MKPVQLSSVKRGDFVRLRCDENAPLWIRSDYERSSKKYSLTSYNDCCRELFRKGSSIVYVEDWYE